MEREILEFKDPFSFFELDDLVQEEYLLKADFESIKNLCSAAGLSKEPGAVRFFQSLCNNYQFWKAKFRNDFPELYEGVLSRWVEPVDYWRSEYATELKQVGYKMFEAIENNDNYDFRKYLNLGDKLGVDINQLYPFGEKDFSYIDDDDDLLADYDGNREYIEELKVLPEWTPLMLASFLGNEEIVNDLLKEGADVNFINPTPSFQYRSLGEKDHGANWRDWQKTEGFFGTTALMLASGMGHSETVSSLLKAGAKPNLTNVRGFAPLGGAINSGDLATFKELIEAGADVSFRSGDNLGEAAEEGKIQIVKELLERGVGPNDQGNGGPALIYAIDAPSPYNFEIVKLLLEYGADPNIPTSNPPIEAIEIDAYLPLHYAIAVGNKQMVKLLLEKRADPFLRNANGEDAYDIAVRRAREEERYSNSSRWEEIAKILEEAMSDTEMSEV